MMLPNETNAEFFARMDETNAAAFAAAVDEWRAEREAGRGDAVVVEVGGDFACAWEQESEVLLAPEDEPCVVRPLSEDLVPALREFGLHGLSDGSRALFECYKWKSPSLEDELKAAAVASLARRDLHVVAMLEDEVIGYGFLWSMADDVPELGLAVADAHHRRGLGRSLLRLLCEAAKAEGKWAVELTTMPHNAPALAAYEQHGFERLGMIRNPLGCDVTAAFRGEATPTGVADEVQMVYVVEPERRDEVLHRLATKRERAAQLFGGSPAAGLMLEEPQEPPPLRSRASSEAVEVTSGVVAAGAVAAAVAGLSLEEPQEPPMLRSRASSEAVEVTSGAGTSGAAQALESLEAAADEGSLPPPLEEGTQEARERLAALAAATPAELTKTRPAQDKDEAVPLCYAPSCVVS